MPHFAIRLAIALLIIVPGALPAGEHGAATLPTVMITGANRGIGLEFVRQYAASGYRVIATARKPDSATALNALAADNPLIVIEQLDVNDLPRVDALATQYADQPIDILINNAAISGSPMREQTFRRFDYELFDAFMDTNARGPLKISEAFHTHVAASEQKKLVLITSRGGLFSEISGGSKGTYFYRASKAAVNMLMVQVAGDVKRYGITVVMLNPGLVDTQGQLEDMNEKMNLGLNITPIEASVAGMRKLIDAADMAVSGQIFNWDGEALGY